MRLAIYYDNITTGRNDGNPLYVTAAIKRISIYQRLIKGVGVDQKEINQWLPKTDLLAQQMAKEWLDRNELIDIDHLAPYRSLNHTIRHDYHLWVDWGEDGLTGLLPEPLMEIPKPFAYWASDTHLGFNYRLKVAKEAEIAFCAQKDAVDAFSNEGLKEVYWLPHAVEPMAYPKIERASKVYDVCFVGHVNSDNRIEALSKLFANFPNFFYGQRRFEDAAQKFAESKIVFNIAMKNDINMRCFESLATGSLLLTDAIPSIEQLFENKKHLVLYRSLEEMIEMAKYYIEHDEEREKIAEEGYRHVMDRHTILHRVNFMLQRIVQKKRSNSYANT